MSSIGKSQVDFAVALGNSRELAMFACDDEDVGTALAAHDAVPKAVLLDRGAELLDGLGVDGIDDEVAKRIWLQILELDSQWGTSFQLS